FAHEEYFRELADLRNGLKAGLAEPVPAKAGATPEPGSTPVAELAEQIKLLKSAHTIDAAPERTAPRRLAAEEPVTARIRRRTPQQPAAERAAEPEAARAATAEEPPAVIPLFPESQPAYRDHAARPLRRNHRQMSLF